MTRPETAQSGGPALSAWLLLAAAVTAIDQLSKWLVLQTFEAGERLSIIPGWFDLTLWFNRGAAFSFLADHDGWQRWFFTVIGIAASGFIVWLLSQSREQRLFSFGLTMILGGAVGNVIDRLVQGKVTDFLLFYQHPYYFPAFNAADSAITLGAISAVHRR